MALAYRARRRRWSFVGALKPVRLRYWAKLFSSVAVLLIAIVATVEAIIVVDLLLSRIMPHVLEHRASLLNAVIMVGLSLPSGIYIALPIATTTAVYFVLLRRREARELMTLAGMGLGVRPLIVFCLGVGAFGLALSLFLSGYVEPLARYAARVTMSNISMEAIRTGAMSAGKFYRFSVYTAFVGSGETDRTAQKVFLLQDLGEDGYRLIVASRSWRLDEQVASEPSLILSNAVTYRFKIADAAEASRTPAESAALRLASGEAFAAQLIMVRLPHLDLPENAPRLDQIAERTSFELLGGDLSDPDAKRAFAERLLQGFLVLAAPILALAAVSLTRAGTFLLALPAAAGLVLVASFFGPRLIEALASLSLNGVAGALAAGVILVIVTCVGVVLRFQNGCVVNGGVQM
ncbi:MAG: LptF/LptG family permease [Alphaproteobacteria bacterium]|nr:LptF/LptG family permease [Alphaproteobacteria bacterium]